MNKHSISESYLMKRVFTFLAILLSASLAAAQDVTACPANVLLALARSATTCANAGYLQACYANGTVQPGFQPGSSATFAQPGDTVDIEALQRLELTADATQNIWSVVMLPVRANLVDVQQRSLAILLSGNVTLTNLITPVPRLTVQAIGALVIREAPDAKSDIVLQLSVGREVQANGRTEDGKWLRVLIPDSSAYGWVSPDLVKNIGFEPLNVVDVNTPIKQPFQEIWLVTGSGDAFCAGTPESGVLFQSPDAITPVTLTMNNIETEISGTVFVQAADTNSLTLQVLDGHVTLSRGGQKQLIPAGSRLNMSSDSAPVTPEPYDLPQLLTLPFTNLPYRFAPAASLTQAQIDAALAQFAIVPTPTPDPASLPEQAGCEYVVIRATSLRAGPAAYYEVLRDFAVGRKLYRKPRLEIKDAEGVAWWQLWDSAWIDSRALETSAECLPVPVTQRVPPPSYNTLIMETCQTTNGPLREGQYVEIEFTPPSWETVQEALDAPSIAPGSIIINNREHLYVYASNPIKVAEEAFIVQFEGDWLATVGKQRIVSKRLFYELICELTVPAGG